MGIVKWWESVVFKTSRFQNGRYLKKISGEWIFTVKDKDFSK
jgi:hypothetical protein